MASENRIWNDRAGAPHRENIRFVLIGTTEPGNIGAAARAIKSMGFGRLVLVNPVDPWSTPHSVSMAHGAEEILENAEVHSSLDDALRGCTCVAGTTRRTRRDQTIVLTPRQWSDRLSELPPDEQIAILFGPEKTGLSNEDVLRCRMIITAPAPVEHPSLNLAQAVMLLSYESAQGLRDELGSVDSPLLANNEELEEMYGHMDTALASTDYPDKRRRALLRHLRIILSRSVLRRDDVNTFHTLARRIRGPVPRKK